MTMTEAPAIVPVQPSTGKRPIPLTIDNVVQALDLVLVERGADYVYTDHYKECEYMVNGAPACIWGVALVGMGYEPDRRWDGLTIDGIIERGILSVRSNKMVGAMVSAQLAQDQAAPYGVVVARFKKAVGRG